MSVRAGAILEEVDGRLERSLTSGGERRTYGTKLIQSWSRLY